MGPSEAEQLIVEVERVRRDTRHAMNPIWYPNIVFGLFVIGTALVALLDAGRAVNAVYWTVGGLVAMYVVAAFYARVERTLGVQSPVLDASTLIVFALIVGVVLANVLTTGDANAYAPLYVGAAAALAMGFVLRDGVELAAGAAIAAVATGVAAFSPDRPGIWGNFLLGAVLVVAGLVGRERA